MATREVVVTSTKEATRIGGNVKERVSSYEHHSSSVSESRQSTGVSLISSESGSTTVSKKSGHVSSGTISNESAYADGSKHYLKEHTALVHGDISREEEKKYFISLNDRLAKYIETIRSLSLTRDELLLLVKEQKSTETTLKGRLEAVYLQRINDSNHQIDLLKNDNAKLAGELKRALADYEAQRRLVAELEKKLHQVEEELSIARIQVQELQSKIKIAEIRVKQYERTNLDLKAGAADYQKRLDELRYQLEVETKKTAQSEGKYLTAKKELEVAHESHRNVLANTTVEHSVEIDEIISRMKLDYNARLLAELKALRIDFENRLKTSYVELDEFKIDFSAINFDAKHHIDETIKAKKEVAALRSRAIELETLVSTHDTIAKAYQRRISELEALAHYEVDFGGAYKHSVVALQNEVNELRRKCSHLLEVRLQLISELNTYHALLEGEEYRLGIYRVIPADHHTGREFISKGHSDVDLVIDEINMLGNYIHLTNKGTKDFNLASWMIKAEAGGLVRKFKFQTNQAINPGKSMTIWSPNRGGTHNPPDSIVMKAVVWPSGDKIHVELLDENEKTKAWYTAYYEVDEHKSNSGVQKQTYIL